MSLPGHQRSYLKGLAHDLKPTVMVGQHGVTDQVIAQVAQALFDHELIKVRLQEPEDKKGMAEALAEGCEAELIGLIGHTVILYKAHPEKPQIHLPHR